MNLVTAMPRLLLAASLALLATSAALADYSYVDDRSSATSTSPAKPIEAQRAT